MPANITPIFAKTPVSSSISVANTAANPLNGVGAVELINGSTEGLRLHALFVVYAATLASSNNILVFINDKLVITAALPTHTVTTTTPHKVVDLLDQEWIDPNDKSLLLAPAATLKVGCAVTTSTVMYVHAQGGYY